MTTIPTQSQYEQNEYRQLYIQLERVEHAPLATRKDGAIEFERSICDGLIQERISWLLDGNYGYGAMRAAQRIARNLRSNRVAQLGQLIAALEWQCPAAMARKVWKGLSESDQAALDGQIQQAIDAYLAEQKA